MKALVLYDSLGGNTEKVAACIEKALSDSGVAADRVKCGSDTDVDFYEYDLVFMGSPSISWLPTKPMMEFASAKTKAYSASGDVAPSCPVRPGKFAVCFCTYAGPHIGADEATPVTMWLRAFLMHLGFSVLDQWLTVGEIHAKPEMNKVGRLGDITGRPNDADLAEIENKVKGLLAGLSHFTDTR